MFAKRREYEAMRSKPWHIVKPDSPKQDVVCGAYRWIVVQGRDTWYANGLVAVDELPAGQIVCSTCERHVTEGSK